MPRSVDPIGLYQLPAQHNPLERLEANPTIKPLDFDEIILQFQHSWEMFVVPAVEQLTGLNLSSAQALVASIIDKIRDLLGNIAGNIKDVLHTIGGLLGFPPAVHGGGDGFGFDDLAAWISQHVFGFIDPNRIPILPASHIGDTNPNLLSNPDFTDTAIYDPEGHWSVDPAVSPDGRGGSATTLCVGLPRELLSIDLIGVARGQKLDLSAWVKMAGVVASAPGAVSLGVTTFTTLDGSGEGTDIVLASVPGYGTKDWQQLKTVYTVPAGVNTLRVRLAVTESATAGQVWFGKLWASKPGLLAITLVDGLGDELAALANKLNDLLKIDEIVAFLEKLTGLEINSGPIAFLQSLMVRLTDLIGLNFTQGPIAFINSLLAKLTAALGIEFGAGPVAFLQSLLAKLTTNLGLDFGGGPIAFINSLLVKLSSILGLNFAQGPIAFVNSLVDRIFAETGVDFSSPAALFASIKKLVDNAITTLMLTIQQIIAAIEAKTGLNIDEGPVRFLQSLVAKIKADKGVDLDTPDKLLGSINHLLAPIFNPDGWQAFIDKVGNKNGATVQTLVDRLQHLGERGKFNALHLDGTVPAGQLGGVAGFETMGEAALHSISNLQLTWDSWLGALTGRPQEDQGSAVLTAAQIEALLAATVANQTALAAIQAEQQAGTFGGVAGGDDFERGEPDLTKAGWAEVLTTATGAGRFAIKDGHQAEWLDAGKADNEARYFRTDPKDAKTKSAYQRITRVNGTKLGEATALKAATDTVFGRVSDDRTKYIVGGANAKGVYLAYNLGAGEQVLATENDLARPSAASSYTLECGAAAGVRVYRLLRNNAPVLIFNDTTGKTAALDNNRGWGWGGKAAGTLLGQLTPSSVNSVTVADNPPEPVIGTFLRAYRSKDTAVAKPPGDVPLPDGTIDYVETRSLDLLFDPVTQVIVVTKPGPYTVTARIETTARVLNGDRWNLLLYRNGKLVARAGDTAGLDGVGVTSEAEAVFGSFPVYCKANDQLEIGFGTRTKVGLVAGTAKQIVGDAAGTLTWLTVLRGS